MDPVQAIQSIQKFVTGDVTYGLLSPEQVKQFYVQIFEQTPFSDLHRKERKTAKTGELDKMAIGSRLLRAKAEGPTADDGYRAAPTFGRVPYTCARIKLPWEVSEEVFHDNIEGEALEDKLMGMFTRQLAIDLEDLHWNGDTAAAPGGDHDFLVLNDGWWKQLVAGAHIVNGALINGGAISKEHFFAAYKAMPAKYMRAGRVRWMMNPATRIGWVEAVSNRATGAGDMALLGAEAVTKPMGIEIVEVPSLDDGKVCLADPMNFISVNTWDVRIRKAAEGKSSVMNDMRYYSVYLDDDPVIEELDAAVIITGMTI
ncbi:MAG: major capsid protein [Actinobacteria bacterium]|nr:major capsid protein [Actinomycetota bacterium]